MAAVLSLSAPAHSALVRLRPAPARLPASAGPLVAPATLARAATPHLSPRLLPAVSLLPTPGLAPALEGPSDPAVEGVVALEEAPRAALPALVEGAAKAVAALAAPDAQARELSGKVFDAAAPAVPVVGPGLDDISGGIVPEGTLLAGRQADAPWLRDVIKTAARSRTGRRVLRQVARLVAARKRPVVVAVDKISNSGEFNYDWDLVSLDTSHRKSQVSAAVTLVHELVHVVQRAAGLPTDALELEIEAYMADFQAAVELGDRVRRGSFEYRARAALERGVWDFVAWLGKEYKDNIPLAGSSLKGYIGRLTEMGEKARRRLAGHEKRLAGQTRVLERLQASGVAQERVEAFKLDVLRPLERRIDLARRYAAWVERDLALLKSPEGARRFRNFSRRVMANAWRVRARLAPQ